MNIAIIAAMIEELEVFSSMIENSQNQAGYTIGRMQEHQIALLQSGIGKVNATMNTTALIQQFKPDYLINTGCAGGIDPNISIGDIIIAEQLAYHDVDVCAFGYDHGQIPQQPRFYTPDRQAWQCLSKTHHLKFNLHYGLIVSGDSFIADLSKTDFISQHFPKARAVDMESCAIAQVCHHHHLPYTIIRAISDHANQQAPSDFKQHITKAARHTLQLIIQLL